ncbi:MAG: sensor domain-containing diguanylate cyclase [Anaerolineales bacterium]|nr:sensor domain-containing diguanylate cyclase [Anaerolineales bacterium]
MKLKRILSIPVFENQEKQRRANILVTTQSASFLMILVILIVSVFFSPDHPEVLLQVLVGAAAMVLSYLLLRNGKLEVSGWIVCLSGWLLLTSDLAFVAGIRGVNVMGQLLIVMFAGLVINGKAALIITIFTIGINFLIFRLELNGILAHPAPLPTDFSRWFIQSVYAILAAIYIWRADTIIKGAILNSQNTADWFRALFDRTSDGVVMFDLDWNVLSANQQALMLLGYKKEEFIGIHAAEIELPEVPELLLQRRTQILQGESLPAFQEMLKKKTGEQLESELSMVLVYDALGKPQHIQCIFRDITDRKAYEATLLRQALYDPLTNLPNRILFENRYQLVQARDEEDQSLVAVLFVDLDNFKLVNDEFGHGIGDQVLQLLGSRLQNSLRDSDTVARMGGDEFMIILENVQYKEDIRKIAQKLLSNISLPMVLEGHQIQITASVGINFTKKKDLSEIDLIKTSDSALYQVKEAGKNNFRFFDPEISN